MGSWIHDEFLDSQWVLGFLDSRWISVPCRIIPCRIFTCAVHAVPSLPCRAVPCREHQWKRYHLLYYTKKQALGGQGLPEQIPILQDRRGGLHTFVLFVGIWTQPFLHCHDLWYVVNLHDHFLGISTLVSIHMYWDFLNGVGCTSNGTEYNNNWHNIASLFIAARAVCNAFDAWVCRERVRVGSEGSSGI